MFNKFFAYLLLSPLVWITISNLLYSVSEKKLDDAKFSAIGGFVVLLALWSIYFLVT